METCICYHIVSHSIPEIAVLPEASIVSHNSGLLQYVEKQASHETIQSAGIEYVSTPHEQLLTICEDLKPIALQKRFQPAKSRKKQTLTVLLQDSKIKEVLLNFVHHKLNTFYQLLLKNNYPLCLGMERNTAMEPLRIKIQSQPLEPILQFIKTDTGISYAFTLQDQKKKYIPKEHAIQILLNEPGIILLDLSLIHI